MIYTKEDAENEHTGIKELIAALKLLKWDIAIGEQDKDGCSKGCICGTRDYVDYVLAHLD